MFVDFNDRLSKNVTESILLVVYKEEYDMVE